MNRKSIFLKSIIFLILTMNILGNEKIIKVAFGDTLPPYVLKDSNSGIIVDLIKKALEKEGYKIKCYYFPSSRRVLEFEKNKVDVICDMNKNNFISGNYLSNMIYEYENILVTLAEKNYEIKSEIDLENHTVLAWQGADMLSNQNKKYYEIASQEKQVKMLYAKRVDAIIVDRFIFEYFKNKSEIDNGKKYLKPIEYYYLFEKNKCGFLFKNQKIRDLFNKNVKEIQKSGEYEKIIKKYIK